MLVCLSCPYILLMYLHTRVHTYSWTSLLTYSFKSHVHISNIGALHCYSPTHPPSWTTMQVSQIVISVFHNNNCYFYLLVWGTLQEHAHSFGALGTLSNTLTAIWLMKHLQTSGFGQAVSKMSPTCLLRTFLPPIELPWLLDQPNVFGFAKKKVSMLHLGTNHRIRCLSSASFLFSHCVVCVYLWNVTSLNRPWGQKSLFKYYPV